MPASLQEIVHHVRSRLPCHARELMIPETMGRKAREELYRKLKRNPKDVRFAELCRAAEVFGVKP